MRVVELEILFTTLSVPGRRISCAPAHTHVAYPTPHTVPSASVWTCVCEEAHVHCLGTPSRHSLDFSSFDPVSEISVFAGFETAVEYRAVSW